MNDNSSKLTPANRCATIKRVLAEAALVAAAGAVLAFCANRLSPRGLSLARNYFPDGAVGPARPEAGPARGPAAREGLQTVNGKLVLQWFHDPAYQEERILFLDARDAEHYREGHIPGALEFDPYHPEKTIGEVLPLCEAAEKIVVYCNGGDCEDSRFAAVTLRDAGISNGKLYVYSGGMGEWRALGEPEETGDRDSGKMRAPGS